MPKPSQQKLSHQKPSQQMPRHEVKETALNADQKALDDAVILIEDSGSLSANENAHLLAKRLNLQVHTIPLSPANKGDKVKPYAGAQWQLVFKEQGLSLRVASEPTWSDIRVDFCSEALNYRKLHGGGRNESVAKAIGIKGKQSLKVLDCTAGMGTDSFIMASVGAHVTLIERSSIISALLSDALQRAHQAQLDVCQQMQLIQSDGIDYLNDNTGKHDFDVVYLDPMFPHKKKSALVKKEMRAFQLLLGPDQDSEQLLSAAINFAAKRVVVKRPSSAPALINEQGLKPSMAISSKKHRFDVYLLDGRI